jgi:hypothetical protein
MLSFSYLMNFGSLCLSRNVCILSKVKLNCIKLFIIFPLIILFISVESVVMLPLSFWILVNVCVCVSLSPFNLARALSIQSNRAFTLLISKTQLLVSWISVCSTSLISPLISFPFLFLSRVSFALVSYFFFFFFIFQHWGLNSVPHTWWAGALTTWGTPPVLL